MAIDTPATIAIIGAGPTGLEAALYARYLGYRVLIFDRGPVAGEVQRWGHATMFSPFAACASTLGLAALHAQDPGWRPPAGDTCLTGRAWRQLYLVPLAQSDLLIDSLHEHCEVTSIEQIAPSESATTGDESQGNDEADGESDGDDEEARPPAFCLALRSTGPSSREPLDEATADVVIDASGVDAWPAWLSGTRQPWPAELATASIEYGTPDILGRRGGFSSGGGSCCSAMASRR